MNCWSWQIDTLAVSAEYDFRDLYRRAASCRLVAIGTVIEVKGVGKRRTAEVVEKMKEDLSATLGGTLYKIRVDDALCRERDFRSDTTVSKDDPQTIYIFLPREEPIWVDGHRQEVLLLQKRYLLFLISPRQSKELVSLYELDPSESYYRAEEGERGAVLLTHLGQARRTTDEPSLVERVTQLCGAMRPKILADKISALEQLTRAGDPVLKKEAAEAIQVLQGNAIQSDRP